MGTSIEKEDFIFSALQKSRIFPSGTSISISRNAFAISSVYQIAVASTGDNKITAFETRKIHSLEVTKQNANKEFTELPKKIVELDKDEKVAGLAVNCDGTFLAVLVNSLSGTFVHIYDVAAFSLKFTGDVYRLTTIRLGAEVTSKGVCINWNPAIADTLAASADDRTLIVAKIDLKNPSSFSLIGNKKMGATVTQISWSPKGKQLTTGDNLGKVCQLKPELDVVRATMPPDVLKQVAPIIGLCWISTTEWLVTFAGAEADAFFFLLSIKKDQQPLWQSIPELQYGNTLSPLSQWFSFDTTLLLSWNVVLLCFSKTSEISVIGKTDQWKVWNLKDESRLDLPIDSSTRETFPIGLAVDLSSSEQVFLDEERTKTHRASPILLVLTSDGVLTAHNVILLDSNLPDCTIESSEVSVKSVRVGKRPPQTSVPASSVPNTGLFSTPTAPTAVFGQASGTQNIFGKSETTIPAAQSVFGQAAGTQNIFGKPATVAPVIQNLFGQPTTTQGQPPAIPIPKTEQPASAIKPGIVSGTASTGTSPAPNTSQLFQPQAASTPHFKTGMTVPLTTPSASLTMKVPSTPVNTQKAVSEPEKEDLSAEIAAVNKTIAEVLQKTESLNDVRGAINLGINSCETSIRKAVSEIPAEGFRVIEEFEKMLQEAELDYRKIEAKVAGLVMSSASKLAIVNKYETNEERLKYLYDSESYDTDEKMLRLTKRIEDVKEKFGAMKKVIDQSSKLKFKPSQLRSSSLINMEERNVIAKHLKALQRWCSNITHKLDGIEDDMKTYNTNQAKIKKEQKSAQAEIKIKSFGISHMTTHDLDVLQAREALRKLSLQQGPVKPRDANPFPFADFIAATQKKSNAFDNIKETLMNSIIKSSTRSQNISYGNKSDASTQIDQPPQIKIIEKEVPIQVPVQVPVTPKTPQFVTPQASVLDQKLKSPVMKPAEPSTAPITSPLTAITPKPIETSTPIAVPKPPVKAEAPVPVTSTLSADKKAPLTAKPSLFPGPAKETETSSIFGGLNLSGMDAKSIFGETKATTPVVEEKPIVEAPKTETPKKEEEKITETIQKVAQPEPVATSVKAETKEEAPPVAKTPEKSSLFNFATTTSTPTSGAKPAFSFAKGGTVQTTESPASTEKPSSIFGPSTTQPSAEKSSIFGGGAAQATAEKPSIFAPSTTEKPASSIFGGGAATKPAETKSIFGGGQATSIFGGAAQTTEQKPAFGQESPAKSSPTFSFKPKESTATATTPNKPSFSFNTKPSAAASGFMDAAKAVVDEGMMEDEVAGKGAASSGFGAFGSMSLGGSSSASGSSTQKSIFSNPISSQQTQETKSGFSMFNTAQKNNPSAFGNFGVSQNATKPSIFGGAQPTQSTGGGIFGGSSQLAQSTGGGIFGGASQQKSTFGSTFGQAAAQAASSSPSSSAFNTSVPKFGAAANFGAAKQSPFGAKPTFSNTSSAFGGGTNPPTGGGFAKYANAGGGSIFGAAAQQQNQGQTQQSIFKFN